ncbi:MAG: hypothetical protein ABWW65_07230 [Thermoprotei archaeon]
MRIRRSSIIIDTSNSRGEVLLEIFENLINNNISSVYVTTRPGYAYARIHGLSSIYQYAIAPGSLVLGEEQLVENIIKELSARRIAVYIIERDTWIDVKQLDLSEYRRLYNEMVSAIREGCKSFKELVVNDYELDLECYEGKCGSLYVIDYISLPYIPVYGRIPYDDPLYRRVIKEYSEKKPREYLLSFIAFNDEYNVIASYRIGSGKPVIRLRVPYGCSDILNYLAWLLLDLLVS